MQCWNCGHDYNQFQFNFICPDCKADAGDDPENFIDDFDTQIQPEEIPMPHEEQINQISQSLNSQQDENIINDVFDFTNESDTPSPEPSSNFRRRGNRLQL